MTINEGLNVQQRDEVTSWADPSHHAMDREIPAKVGGSQGRVCAFTKDDDGPFGPYFFARNVLAMDDPSQLCPLLQTLDQEEVAWRVEVRTAISKNQQLINRITNVAFGLFDKRMLSPFAVGVVGGVAVGVLNRILPLGVGYAVGAIGAGITLYRVVTAIRGLRRNEPQIIRDLGTAAQIAARLQGKVQRIVEERAKKGKSPEEQDQLIKVEKAFRKLLGMCPTDTSP